MKKILVCFGTRPEAIKMAPVIYELKKNNIEFKVCNTAQHKEMLDQVLNFFEIEPDYNLNCMRENQSLNELSSRIIDSFDKVLEKEKPEIVLVHGDTTTSVMVAWASFHKQIPVGHVEAGLRTFNPRSPFPEEINRQITGRLAEYHFAPTRLAKENLIKEHVVSQKIFITGNTIVDALQMGISKVEEMDIELLISKTGLKTENLKKYILVTGHRRESIGDGFEAICEALLEIAKRGNLDIIYPVHLNPNVRNHVYRKLQNEKNIHLIDPVEYPAMLYLLKNCEFVISDSGGIQEEAPSFGKKLLVTRELSERMEAVDAGTAVLVGTNTEKIVAESLKILKKPSLHNLKNPFGDGNAAARIVEILSEKL